MKKIDKKLLATLLALNNAKANEYLSKTAEEIKSKVFAATSNEERIELLQALKEFVYRVPTQAVEIVQYVISNPLPSQETESPFGLFSGKEPSQVVDIAVDLLKEIRYINPDGVVPILVALVRSDKSEKGKAADALKRLANYDFNVLTKSKLGYGPQRWLVDFISKWKLEERIENIESIEIIAKEVLSSSVEGTTNDAMDTITFHTGVVQPTEFLRKLRREMIDLIVNLYENVSDEGKKVKLVKVLEQAIRGPMSVAYGDDVEQMLVEDGQYLLDVYRKMLFNDQGVLVGSIAVAEEIEKRLYWFHNSQKFDTPEARKLRTDILSDSFFSLFRLFAGDDVVYRQEEKDVAPEENRDAKLKQTLGEVTEATLKDWNTNLNRVAAQVGVVDEWQFRYLKVFMRQLAATKPEIAFQLIESALKENNPLRHFVAPTLDGFRDAKRVDLWDQVVSQLIGKKEDTLLAAIPYSMNLDREDLKETRKDDIDLLEEIVQRTGRFGFLADQEKPNFMLEHATINALLKHFCLDKARVEGLILVALQRSAQLRNLHVRELDFAVHKKWIDYSQFSADGKTILKNWLIELEDFDWDAQAILLDLSKDNPQHIFDVFWGRIDKDAKRKAEKPRDIILAERYTAIPHHFTPELVKQLSEIKNLPNFIQPWLEYVTPEWSIYSWDISRFIKETGSSFRSIIFSLLDKGDDANIGRAVQLMDRFDGESIELCMDVIRRTDDKGIISRVDAMLVATGVVMGEDGIARAYEQKANELEKFKDDESPRVKKYVARMVDGLRKDAARQRQDAAEDKQLRKIDFEG